MGDISVHPALVWHVPHAWDGRTCAADLYQKNPHSVQATGTVVGTSDLDSHAGIEFNFCDDREAWRTGVSGLGCGASWRMCPEASGLVVARGQEPLIPHWLQLSMSSTWLGPGAGQRGCSQHIWEIC